MNIHTCIIPVKQYACPHKDQLRIYISLSLPNKKIQERKKKDYVIF